MPTTITDAYQEYEAGCGSETPARTLEELRDLIRAAGLRYEQIDARFWTLAFGADDEPSWAWGLDWPTPEQWARFERTAASN